MTPYAPGSTTMPLPLTSRICLFSNAHQNVPFCIRRTPKRRKTRSKSWILTTWIASRSSCVHAKRTTTC